MTGGALGYLRGGSSVRARVLGHWLAGRRNGVSLGRMMAYFFGRPAASKARAQITGMEVAGGRRVISLRDGLRLFYPLGADLFSLYEVIAEAFDPRGWHYYEADETRVAPEDVVVDCGAAEGLFSLLASRKCRKVYAIEPLPMFVESLRLTFADVPNVEVVPVALSSEAGRAFINESGISSSLGASGSEVEVTTLDALFYQRSIPVTYIKADLEGQDMEMLKGARETIRQNRPRIAITTYHNPAHAGQMTAFLKDLVPSYRFRVKGVAAQGGAPVMLHAWSEGR
ncbi:MAG: hypothetical protein Kow0025_12800 [Thermodesulfovibrionales bacterium]